MGYGIEYSLRIKALGPDFAYLIPDYETDLYQFPNLYNRDNRFIGIVPKDQFSIKLTTSRFGLLSQFWGESRISLYPRVFKYYRLTLNDLWLWDARKLLPSFMNDVWNITNDLYWDKAQYNGFDCTQNSIHYLFGIPASDNIGKYFDFYGFVVTGFHSDQFQNNEIKNDRLLLIVSGKLGISYRNSWADNDFISGYLEIGGPVTNTEIDDLGWSFMSEKVPDNSVFLSYFLNTFNSKIGLARAVPITSQSFFAFGIRNQLRYQRMMEQDNFYLLTDIRNISSLPLAIEYQINAISIRLGADFTCSALKRMSQFHDVYILNNSNLQLGWATSCGLGWRISPKFNVDFYQYGISLGYGFNICLKYIF
jgi:hypothetical protein